MLASAVIASAVLLSSPPALHVVSATGSERPNIVVFYIDDAGTHDGRLWNNAELTPNMYEQFVAGGIYFPNAIGETPLCCPGRVGTLTGQHTQNHGVTVNDGRLFKPAMHIGQALLDAGYATMFVGKYLNRNSPFTAADWKANGAGWTYLDVVRGWNGQYFNYTVHTKTGSVRYLTRHSTAMVADRTIDHLRATPASQPVFAVVSIYNLHQPNLPMPEFASDARCDDMPPWKPPNYNEQDVSDKPAPIRALPLLRAGDGWPMQGLCREMLGIDQTVGRVVEELRQQGRLDNTLLVFTSDNGMTWGAHRVAGKRVPYATPVPL